MIFLVTPHAGPVRILRGLEGRRRDKLAHLPQDILGSKPVGVLLQHLKHTGQQLTLASPGDLSHRTSTVSSVARLLGVSRATIYKYIPEVTTGRGRRPASRTGAAAQATKAPRTE